MDSRKTNPTVQVKGGDENYAELNGFDMCRPSLNDLDVESGRNVCVVGSDLVTKFFNGNAERAVEKIIKVNGIPYRIVGTMAPKGPFRQKLG